MRKLSLLLLAMLMVSSMVFAQVQVEYELEAEATATFGVNLDGVSNAGQQVKGPTSGFQLDHNIDLNITLIEEQTTEFGEGDTYGYIEIEDFEVTIAADGAEGTAPALGGTNGDITAKVFMGPAYIVVATADNDVDQAAVSLNLEESIFGLAGNVAGTDDGTSVAVGYDIPDLFNIELVIASDSAAAGGTADDWSDNLYNNYKGAIFTETTIDMLTISVDLSSPLRTHITDGDVDGDGYNGSEAAGDFGDNAFVGLGFEYEMPLDDMITLIPYLGFDLFNDAAAGEADDSTSGREGAMDWEVIAGAKAVWGDADQEVLAEASDESQQGVGVEFGLGNDYHATNDTATFDNYMFFRAAFLEAGGDDGLLPVVGAIALVEYSTMTSTVDDVEGDALNKLGFLVELDADLGVVSPFFGLMWANSDLDDVNATDDEVGLGLNLGVDINVISATTFTVEYSSGNLLLSDDDTVVGDGNGLYDGLTYGAGAYYDTALDNVTGKMGTLTFATKIEY